MNSLTIQTTKNAVSVDIERFKHLITPVKKNKYFLFYYDKFCDMLALLVEKNEMFVPCVSTLTGVDTASKRFLKFYQ